MVLLSGFIKETTASKLNELKGHGELRPYLGCSQIGHDCMRYLWLSFHWCYEQEIHARLKRLFLRGHREEPEIIKELTQIGIRCYDDQAECNFVSGHMSGHCDGKAIGVIEAPKTEHLLEFKTASDKKFKEMVKLKVQKANPVYYAQLQIYMLGLKLTRALFIMVNKNDDTFHIERIRFDKGFAEDLVRKGSYIVSSEKPDPIQKPCSKTWFKCKWCDARAVCMEGAKPLKTCRTCKKVLILEGAKWGCSFRDMEISTSQQRQGCKQYECMSL